MDDNETRARAMQAIRATPGMSTRAIARLLAADESTADYHLRRLQRQKLVASERAGRELAWYARSCGFCPVLRRAVPLFRREEVARVARALDERPRAHPEIAQRADVPVGSVRWIVPLLVQAGMATKGPSGRVALRNGARLCVAKAAGAAPCDAWGRCEVSRAMGPLAPER